MLLNQTVIRLLSGHGAGGGKSKALEVDTTNLHGFNRWLGDSYNDHRALFAAGTVVGLLVAGVVIGLLAEAILTRLGLGAKAIENHE